VEFNHPRLVSTIKDFDELFKLMENSSSLVGFFISLGKKFVNSKTKDLDEDILPRVQACLGDSAVSRVCIGYSVLMWFVVKVRTVQQLLWFY